MMNNDIAGGTQQLRKPSTKIHKDSDVTKCNQQSPNPSIRPPSSASRYTDLQSAGSVTDGSLSRSGDDSMGDDSVASNSLHPDEGLHKPSVKMSSPMMPRGILKTPTPFFDVLRLPLRGKGSIEKAAGVSGSNAETKERASKQVSFAEGTIPGGVAAFDRPLGWNKANWPPEILEEMERGVEEWIRKSKEMEAGGKFVPSEREERMIQGALRNAALQKWILAKKASEKKRKQGSKRKGTRATRMKANKADLKAKTASKIEVQTTTKIEETKATRIGVRKEVRALESMAKHRSVMKWLGLSTDDEK